MHEERFSITIDGAEIEGLYDDLISLEVDLDDDLAGMFRLSLALLQQPDGRWSYLDDERIRVWKAVTIEAGFDNALTLLFDGYITHLKPLFGEDPTQCTLAIWGIDSSILMDREEKLKDWPDKKDSDIASELFSQYGFQPEVEETALVHEEPISTVIQRESDMQFLRRLARRNGYECYVQGESAYFGPPKIDETPQPVLAVHFGDETTLLHFALEVNALAPVNVAMFQVDRASKEILDAEADSSQQRTLGATAAPALLAPGVDAGLLYVSGNVTTGAAEMSALCQGLYHQGEWFVYGEGEVAANRYGHVLLPRRAVTIKGLGESYSGVYYVSHVTHHFSTEGYRQQIKVKRNALLLNGDEDFAGGDGGLLGGLL